MDDLLAFLRARVDDDERLARTAAEGISVWHDGSVGETWATDRGLVFGAKVALWDCEGADSLCMPEATAAHVARHDPARVLADVVAKRKIIDGIQMCRPCGEGRRCVQHDSSAGSPTITRPAHPVDEQLVRLLALPYADNPGYREEWRP